MGPFVGVVAPLDGGEECIDVARDEHAQANGTGQEAFLGGGAIDLGAVIACRLVGGTVDRVLLGVILALLL